MQLPQGCKVAVISHRHIGDTLLTEPIVRFLKEAGCRVTIYVKSKIASLTAAQFSTPAEIIIAENFSKLYKLLRLNKNSACHAGAIVP